MEYYCSTEPATEPVTLAEAKAHLRIVTAFTSDDTLITGLLTVARQSCEEYCQRSFITQSWAAYLDDFEDIIALPRPKLNSVTSIQYVDTSGDTQTLSTDYYNVHTIGDSGYIELAYGYSWPTVRDQKNAVTIVFATGYGDADDVPKLIKQGILVMLADFYNNPESIVVGKTVSNIPLSVERILNPYVFRGRC